MITINVVTIMDSDNHGNGDKGCNGDDETCHDNDDSINYV